MSSPYYILPAQARITSGPLYGIRGLCIFQETEDSAIFFLPEKNHQSNRLLFPITNSLIDELEIEQLIQTYGEDTNGVWISDSTIIWEDTNPKLFPFFKITPSELPLWKIIYNLQKEISDVSPSDTAPRSDRDIYSY